MDGMIWAIVIVGGPLLLGLAIFLFGTRRRRLNRVEREIADERAHENWGKEEIR